MVRSIFTAYLSRIESPTVDHRGGPLWSIVCAFHQRFSYILVIRTLQHFMRVQRVPTGLQNRNIAYEGSTITKHSHKDSAPLHFSYMLVTKLSPLIVYCQNNFP